MTTTLDDLPLPVPTHFRNGVLYAFSADQIRAARREGYELAMRKALEGREPVGYLCGPLEWNPRQSETVVKITRRHQSEYGFTHPIYDSPPPKSDEASEVLALLDSGEWELTRHPDTDSMLTDEWCAKNRWSVRRTTAPFCGRDGVRCWSAPTPLEAFAKAHAALAAQQKGGE